MGDRVFIGWLGELAAGFACRASTTCAQCSAIKRSDQRAPVSFVVGPENFTSTARGPSLSVARNFGCSPAADEPFGAKSSALCCPAKPTRASRPRVRPGRGALSGPVESERRVAARCVRAPLTARASADRAQGEEDLRDVITIAVGSRLSAGSRVRTSRCCAHPDGPRSTTVVAMAVSPHDLEEPSLRDDLIRAMSSRPKATALDPRPVGCLSRSVAALGHSSDVHVLRQAEIPPRHEVPSVPLGVALRAARRSV
jgi:hypothetical protein